MLSKIIDPKMDGLILKRVHFNIGYPQIQWFIRILLIKMQVSEPQKWPRW
jgi:hypothetical protein